MKSFKEYLKEDTHYNGEVVTNNYNSEYIFQLMRTGSAQEALKINKNKLMMFLNYSKNVLDFYHSLKFINSV